MVWISDDGNLLKLRFLVAGHIGMSGHRGWRTSKASAEAQFTWTGLAPDVVLFVKSCIHWLYTEREKWSLDPWGTPGILLRGARVCISIFYDAR